MKLNRGNQAQLENIAPTMLGEVPRACGSSSMSYDAYSSMAVSTGMAILMHKAVATLLRKTAMFRNCALLIAVVMALAWHSPARASGDFECSPGLKLNHTAMSGCDNMVVLQPGNDTRVNLTLLMLDREHAAPVRKPGEREPASPTAFFEWGIFKDTMFPKPDQPEGDGSYADGEGSRCRSNATGAEAFEAAVNAASKVPSGERADLIAARKGLQPSCTGASGGAAAIADVVGRMKSSAGKAFAHYLQGARAFYDGDYDRAATEFAALHTSDQPWLKETARYMLGRVEVNRAQVNAFDEYGSRKEPSTIDAQIIARAEAGLRDYVRDYPKGLYAISARGLLRRVYWLSGNTAKLAAEYAALFALPPAERGLDDAALADEMDSKLLPDLKLADTHDPILLAVLDLSRMRSGEYGSDEGGSADPIAIAELEAQRPYFASNPALFEYLLAAHSYYVAKQPGAVMRLLPDAARQASFSHLQFSRQMLRGMALDAIKDRNARGFWLEMLGGTKQPFQRSALELALAMHDERTGALDRVFEAGSPVHDSLIRETLLTNVAGPALLRRQAKDAGVPQHEREVALFTLLYKEVSRGAYRDFLADQALVPAGAPTDGGYQGLLTTEHPAVGVFRQATGTDAYDCPALKEVASQLAGNPRASKPRLCLAEFMRLNGFDDFMLDSQPPKDQLGGTTSLFPGPMFSRLELYKEIIADAAAPGPDKAYALYRAVNCYGPSGNNTCGGVEVPIAQRKAWFLRLKKDYATSYWAKDQRYYW
jgi:hypothetical protein